MIYSELCAQNCSCRRAYKPLRRHKRLFLQGVEGDILELAAKGMLHYYSERFRTVEINNTFYRMPSVSVLEAWAGEVPADFKFVIKAPRQITHIHRT